MRISDWSSDVCSSDLEEDIFWGYQCAGDEMIAPENIFLVRLRQCLFQYPDQPQHHGIEIFVHELGAFGAVRCLRTEGAVILPYLAALNIEGEVGVEEGVERLFDRRAVARGPIIIVERTSPFIDRDDGAVWEHRT